MGAEGGTDHDVLGGLFEVFLNSFEFHQHASVPDSTLGEKDVAFIDDQVFDLCYLSVTFSVLM